MCKDCTILRGVKGKLVSMMEINKVRRQQDAIECHDELCRGFYLLCPLFSLDYMSNNPGLWMFKTIEDCCKRYYSWDVVTCMSSDSSYVDPTKDLFYPDWGKTETCKNDGLAVSMDSSARLW